ncbi:hypothetical protein GCM10010415_43380 [Streptomyces atrovirens]|uniref:YD repeat-containing protein n=1 Tax=Streptomyces atrovirens TaxID=285556 RepID=A0ABW0DWD2_9ACTN
MTSHQGWSARKYTYDKAGRLTNLDDTAGEVCPLGAPSAGGFTPRSAISGHRR